MAQGSVSEPGMPCVWPGAQDVAYAGAIKLFGHIFSKISIKISRKFKLTSDNDTDREKWQPRRESAKFENYASFLRNRKRILDYCSSGSIKIVTQL